MNVKVKRRKVSIDNLYKFLNTKAEQMRNSPTKWETIMSNYLKELGYAFDSQVPVICQGKHGYILDFFLTESKIFIEIDSKQWHSSKEQIKKDNLRTKRLIKEGYIPLRFWNSQLTNYTKNQILDIIAKRIISKSLVK